MTNDSQQPAPFPAGGNQPTTSGSNDAPTQFIPPTEQSVPPTQTMPPVQDVPAQTPSYNDRVYATSLQQVMQAVHDQLSTSATFTVDEENVAEGTVTFHSYDGAQFTLKASAQGADGTAIKLDVTGDDGGTRTAEFLSVLDPALLPTAAPTDAAKPRRRRTKAQKIWKILNTPQFTGASGNRSKLAIAALVYSILMVLSTFAPAALEWGMLFSMAFVSLLLTFAALYVTRPGGKVTGQLFAWIAAVLTVLGFVIGSVGIVVSGALEKAAPAAALEIECKAFSWPKTNIGTKLPTPESTTGGNLIGDDDMLSIDVCDTNDEQYAAYIDAVLEKGFTVDYSRSDGWFSGETKDGYSVTISRDESNKDIMSISLYGPDDSSTSDTSTSSDTSASNSSNFPSIPARSAPAISRTTTRSWLDARRNLRPSASDAVFGTPPIHIRKKDSNGFSRSDPKQATGVQQGHTRHGGAGRYVEGHVRRVSQRAWHRRDAVVGNL
ncbi:DUF6591 domain-containing protein [Bifidobacterium bifidum]|uniref:DUF6591 domain-containing protein n=1 Tax=Bifidobacterium bifidum TaxID=1681 RepID=UPI0006CB5233|nr:DUF6591 domain-containing protein [Bifidobacterium bifidum]ALE11599.1 Permease [Bifidobacterium bifidum]